MPIAERGRGDGPEPIGRRRLGVLGRVPYYGDDDPVWPHQGEQLGLRPAERTPNLLPAGPNTQSTPSPRRSDMSDDNSMSWCDVGVAVTSRNSAIGVAAVARYNALAVGALALLNAMGVVTFGGVNSMGLVAIGGVNSIGIVSIGGINSIGLVAIGGLNSVGLVAIGGGSVTSLI